MRKLLIAAVAAASLGTLGLTATAQAQIARPFITSTSSAKTVVAGIPATIQFTHTFGTNSCTVSVSGLPGPVTAGTAASVNRGCTVQLEGVWPSAGKDVVTIKFTAGGSTSTITLTVTVLAMPCENDAVGVGSDTLTPLTDQLSSDYNNTLKNRTKCGTTPFQYSWDAVNPVTGAIGDSIPEKTDCASIPRPDGSSAGINQLKTFVKSSSGPFCTNYARSSRARKSTDPPYSAGGVAFTALAGDAISWSVPTINTFAPTSLSDSQLTEIWSCTVPQANNGTGANQWGDLNPALTGSAATTPIQAFAPQNGSGTYATWLTDLGLTAYGACVLTGNNTIEENEGVNPLLNVPGGIFFYSVGDYIAQKFHADACLNSGCTANSSGVICVKTPDKVPFWCDVHGVMNLGQIDGVAPTTGSGTSTVINSAFPSKYDRTLYDVVPWDPATTDHIPGVTSPVGGVNLSKIFGATGFDCTNSKAKTDIKNYGFVTLPTCGSTS
jgi:ABC-type phosphate transport system substrate-binding protein